MKILCYLLVPVILGLASCQKQELVLPPVDESQWLNQERGIVAFSEFGCDYYVVETGRGFALLRHWSGPTPLRGSVLYGNFSSWGLKTFYVRSSGYLVRADVRDYWMTYWQAIDEMEWSCGK